MTSLKLPASFRFPRMETELAEADGMYDGRDGHYVSVAMSALRVIEDALHGAPEPPRRILDLPCGHGRVTRVLRARFPDAAITVCDLDRDGVDFAAARFGARGVYSVEDFRALDLGEAYDLIWVGSLVTHLPETQTRRFLDCMARHMTPRATLVVSSHGALVEARLRSSRYGLAPEAVSGLLADHARAGYGYRDYPGGQGYGISLISREWVDRTLSEGPLRLHGYLEAAWDDHHDVLVLRRRGGVPGLRARRLLAGLGRLRGHGAAPLLDRTPVQGKEPRPGQGVREAVRKAAQAVSARFAGRFAAGRTGADGLAAQSDGGGMMNEQRAAVRDAAPAEPVEAFDEARYLASYPDIAEAVARGEFASGRAHYRSYGRQEGRSPFGAATPEGAGPAEFDEAWYLAHYPDVAAAVRRGDVGSGLEHFLQSGRGEGRLPSPGYHEGDRFDEAWYAASYPMARRDVEAGLASGYAEHYAKRGRARGYLPNRFAPRPADPAAPPSRFGGLWPDRGNALDLVEGKREIGAITEEQADQLRHWIAHGHLVLRGAIPAAVLDRAEEELDRAYRGEVPELLFSCPAIAPGEIPWEERVSRHPAKALDLHWLSPAVRDLIFAPELRRFLELIFERRALASQSLAFLRGSAQSHHMDTFYVPYTSPMQFTASWIALEDVAAGAGELAYLEGSHALPEHLLFGEYKSVWEVQRMTRNKDREGAAEEYEARLSEAAEARGMAERAFLAKRGDVLFWHAGLAHGGRPISQARTRKSVVTHYCPREVAPLSWEHRPTPVRSHGDAAYYTSMYYGEEQHR